MSGRPRRTRRFPPDPPSGRSEPVLECGLCRREPSAWELDAIGAEPSLEGRREVLFTLGNGYFATRGSSPESVNDGVHYPGTYVSGIYNRLTSVVDGAAREDESLVNLPDWTLLTLASPDGSILDSSMARIEHEHRRLDMHRGTLTRLVLSEDHHGRRTLVRQQRLVSMDRPHLAFLRTVVTALNWSGTLRLASGIDGDITNDNVASFRGLCGRHLHTGSVASSPDGVSALQVDTVQSRARIAVVAHTRVDGQPIAVPSDTRDAARLDWTVPVVQGAPLRVDKVASVFTSRDHAISEPLDAAEREIANAPGFRGTRRAHAAEWRRVWDRMHLELDAGEAWRRSEIEIRRAVNLHLFHVAQVLSRHTSELDVGIPARGLHGEAYRGLVFWDELFVFPLLNLRMPELTRSLLMYRYRRLPEARRLAQSVGADGALFPWQSGSDGREETPESLYNPRAGRWMPDNSRLQFHVGLAVAYNTWHYYQVTGDIEFLASHGAELLTEIARFWSARAELDPETGRYHLRGMMGPDEFHDGYPTAPGCGIDDNSYVAVLAAWLFVTVRHAHELLRGHHADELWQRLGLDESELERWDELSRRLHVPFLPNGLIAQFQGYGDLEEFDFEGYRARYGDIGRLDLILAAEGDATNRYKVSKQADTLMLFYLFSAEELTSIMRRLGVAFDPASIPETIEYYLSRTTHGSTLSRVVHAWVLARGDRRASWELLHQALGADLEDTQGGTTREGVHLGAMAATADILQRCFTGLQIRDDAVHLHPQLPDAITRLTCPLRYRGHLLGLEITHRSLNVRSAPGAARPIAIVVDGREHVLRTGTALEIPRPLAPAPMPTASL